MVPPPASVRLARAPRRGGIAQAKGLLWALSNKQPRAPAMWTGASMGGGSRIRRRIGRRRVGRAGGSCTRTGLASGGRAGTLAALTILANLVVPGLRMM